MTFGNMRFLSVWLLSIIIIFFLTQQSVNANELSKVEEDYLKKNGPLIFVSQTNYPPFEFLGSDGDRTGMCIDLVRWIATEFGFKVNFTDTSFKQAQDDVLSGKAHILTSLFYSEKRDQVFDFTKTVFTVPASIFVMAERPDIININYLQGKIIAIQSGDYAQEFLESKGIKCSYKYTTDFAEATELVIANKADAIIGDEQIVLYHIFSSDLTDRIKKVGEPLYIGQNCMGAKDPNPILIGIMNKGIELAQNKGVLDQIYKKWIGTRYSPQLSWLQQFFPYFLYLMAGFILVTVLVWVWNIRLRKTVFDRTSELTRSEETLRTILNASPLGIGIARGRILGWHNVAMSRMLGYPQGELEGQDIKVLYQGNHHLEQASYWSKDPVQQNSIKSFETQWIRKDGSVFPCQLRVAPLRLEDDKSMTITIAEDITERKRAEKALLENNELLTSFIRNSPVYCYIKEVSPKRSFVLQASENFEEMIGIKGSQMIGKTMEELFPPEFAATITADDWDIVSKGGLLKIDETLNGRNYTTIKFPIVLGGKTLLAGYTIDITERNQAETEKLMAQKITDENRKQALIGRIAGKMAHDFNNILGIIMGNAELALIDCPDHQTKKKLDLIYNQTIRGKNLTKNLVAFAKDQEPKQEFFSIGEKIDLVLNLLKKDLDGINVIRQYSHGIPELLADPGMIEHAIVNLVQNSIHAVSLVERPQIIVRIYHQGEFIFFEIEDNGCGIPSEFLGGIYEPSFTLKGSKDKNGMYKPGIKGTGYGMSNVKRYIEQHKGNISIHSELQKGTNVTIKLPVIKKELTDEEIKDVKKEKIYFEKHILLVEDEQAISDIQYSILTHDPCNHRVDVANTGQMAIDLLKRNQYDLISLDYVLPGNFNGMDVYHHIRERNNAVPVLFISGNIEFLESIKDLKQKDPYIDHLSKPCKNIDYVNGVNKLFRSVAI
jgi:PAS domain S-box-containing protein